MPRHFDARLVNAPFEDPGLYVDLVFQRRAMLFDLGEISSLSTRKLLRVGDIFITHRHMDHFIGFDCLLRRLLGRDRTINLFGPEGVIDAVEHKLRAYNWNLIGGSEGQLAFCVMEINSSGVAGAARFAGSREFARESRQAERRHDGVILKEPDVLVKAATLDHGMPVLAFAVQERAHVNIWRNKAEAMGLAIGPWLGTFKEAVIRGAPDDTQIDVSWRESATGAPATLPLGELRQSIMRMGAGGKLVYVTDCAYTDANIETIVRLAENADILFIEATFLQSDAEIAAARRHLTAWQAGTIARLAGAKRVVTFHYSPRYRPHAAALDEQAQQAFRGD
ncbi:ribonuclease Z [Methylocystis heyeri]|uniref:Ribonuclease Z n=1 Tax=Methylocystis heyeri TaxID=391905 RepID=A0A6B8K8T1_9HYPH|nr:MBL fold metallo-hydrolase [Methylocystis heyeri]QGM44446.1 ribonuclease Z [Methylocystis heyeri]